MPVIKSNGDGAAPAVGKMAALNIANFTEQAQRIVTDARAQADQIIAAARQEAEQIRREAHAAGHAEGHAQGVMDGQADGAERAFAEASQTFTAQTEQLQAMLRETIDEVAAARDQLLLDARGELLEFALQIAEKITHTQARGDIAAAKGNLAGALHMANCAAKIQVKVCPGQMDHLREYAAGFMEEMGMNSLVTFVPDPDLAAGDVVLQTRNGEVDGRIATQFDDIVRLLTGREEDDE